MNEVDPGQPASASATERVGDRLRAAREAKGMQLAEIAQRTRVPQRHLEAIEASNFAGLPSPTYAVGFARAYARALGMDEVAIAQEVRGELATVERPPEYEPYETADPARVPSRGLAVVGLGVAVAIVILVGLWYGTDLFRSGGSGSSVTTAAVPAAAPPVTVTPPAAPAATPRQVTLTAGADEVWMRVYDAADKTLYLGTLAPGASFDVPPTADRPMINVGRPDELVVKVDGRAIPPLGDGKRPIKDVPVDAASIAARLTGTPATEPTAAATPTTSSTPSARSAASSPRSEGRARPRPRPSAALSETQRANLESAAPAAAPSNATETP